VIGRNLPVGPPRSCFLEEPSFVQTEHAPMRGLRERGIAGEQRSSAGHPSSPGDCTMRARTDALNRNTGTE